MRGIFKFNFPRKNETPYRKILFHIPISRVELHVTRVITPSSIVEHSLLVTLYVVLICDVITVWSSLIYSRSRDTHDNKLYHYRNKQQQFFSSNTRKSKGK